jgi:hypothetical protein
MAAINSGFSRVLRTPHRVVTNCPLTSKSSHVEPETLLNLSVMFVTSQRQTQTQTQTSALSAISSSEENNKIKLFNAKQLIQNQFKPLLATRACFGQPYYEMLFVNRQLHTHSFRFIGSNIYGEVNSTLWVVLATPCLMNSRIWSGYSTQSRSR